MSKMTDKEIIKASECCIKYDMCVICPCYSFCGGEYDLLQNTFDLINRQQAEIEDLKEDNFIKSQKRANIFEILNAHEKGRAEAIKEYKEKLREHAYLDSGITGFQEMVVDLSDIENIADEVVGEGK